MKRHPIVTKGTPAAIMAAGVLLMPLTGRTAEPPPSLIVVGKTVNYRQSADTNLTLLNYHFFAEVFQSSKDAGGSAQLIDPKGAAIPFRSDDGGVLAAGGDHNFHSLEDLNAQIPNGNYAIHYTRPGAPPLTAAVKMNATATAIADAFRIRLLQDGHEAVASAIDPAQALVIEWSPFVKGRADPKGVSDDLIFVHVGDCRGQVIARTPAPFSGDLALTYRSASYFVPANRLAPGSVYQISVEQAPVETSRTEGVPTLATYPATVFFDFRTKGEGSTSCPSPPYRMDHGQSDRRPAP